MNSKTYFFEYKRNSSNTAGEKAPEDMCATMSSLGLSSFQIERYPAEKSVVFRKLWLLIKGNQQWRRLYNILHNGDTVIYQHPMYGIKIALFWLKRIKKRKQVRFVALIHDLESLRGGIKGLIKNNRARRLGDTKLLCLFDYVICHNEHMKGYLINQGFEPEKLGTLDIFDYLCNKTTKKRSKGKTPSISIAGNLSSSKCNYIYDLFNNGYNQDLHVNLYGNRFDEQKASCNMKWYGSFRPEELPNILEGDFGLVWDGESIDSCTGNTGNYLRYNNPHKTSLYIAAGLPVIVWEESAISDFVKNNNLGITVSNLYYLDEVISRISNECYKEMCINVESIGDKLRKGYYFKRALRKAGVVFADE